MVPRNLEREAVELERRAAIAARRNDPGQQLALLMQTETLRKKSYALAELRVATLQRAQKELRRKMLWGSRIRRRVQEQLDAYVRQIAAAMRGGKAVAK